MTDADFVTQTRTFYDTVAEDYAVHFHGLHGTTPLDRGLLAGFAELVGEGARSPTWGAGPGG